MTLSLDATSFTVGSGEISTGYKLDGSVTTTDTERGQIATKAAWKGDHIVIETTAPGPNGSITTTTSWYLEGESLVRETSRPGPDGQPIAAKAFFKRS